MPFKILIIALWIFTTVSTVVAQTLEHPLCGQLTKCINVSDAAFNILSVLKSDVRYGELNIKPKSKEEAEIEKTCNAMEEYNIEALERKESPSAIKKAVTDLCNKELRNQTIEGFKNKNWANTKLGEILGSKDLDGVASAKQLGDKASFMDKSVSSHCDLSVFKKNINCEPLIGPTDFTGFPNTLFQLASHVEANDEKNLPSSYSPDDCKCLDTKWVNSKGKLEDFNRLAAEVGDEFDAKVFKAVGNKFVNEYAALIEDNQYYLTIDIDVLLNNENQNLKQALCQDPEAFQKQVDKTCGANGTMDGRAERMSSVLKMLEKDKAKSNEPFAMGLKTLVDDINILSFDPSKVKMTSNRKNYSRKDWDGTRLAVSKERPEVQLTNDLISTIMLDKKMRAKLEVYLYQGKTPAGALFEVLTGPYNAEMSAELLATVYKSRKKLKNPTFDSSIVSAMDSIAASGDKAAALEKLLTDAMTYSPGLKNLLFSSELLKETEKYYNGHRSSSVGMLGAMQEQKRALNGHLAKRCETLQENLATIVCQRPGELKKQLSPTEMAALLSRDPLPAGVDPILKDKAICQLNANPIVISRAFSGIGIKEGQVTNSDYISRKKLISEDNAFENMAYKIVNNPDFADKVGQAGARTGYLKVSQGEYAEETEEARRYSFFKSENMSHPKNLERPATLESNPLAAISSEAIVEKASVDQSTVKQFMQSEAMSSTPTYVAPVAVTPPTVAAAAAVAADDNKEEEARISRERLAKELGQVENKSQIKNHLSDISEEDAQEILRLRDQAMKDRATISDLRIQQEREKTEALRAEYDKLKMRLDNLEQPAGKVEVAATGVTQFKTGSNTTADNGGTHFDTATLASPISTGGASGGRGAVEAMKSAFAAGAMASKELAAGGSNAAGVGAGVGREIASEARGSMNLVVTQTVGTDGKIQAAEDPNNALINYLTKNEPSMQQLQELKTSGLLYTEEDVTKEGKKIQTKKVIKYSELSVEAKRLVERKLATVQLQEAKRNYSRQALMLELLTVSNKKTI